MKRLFVCMVVAAGLALGACDGDGSNGPLGGSDAQGPGADVQVPDGADPADWTPPADVPGMDVPGRDVPPTGDTVTPPPTDTTQPRPDTEEPPPVEEVEYVDCAFPGTPPAGGGCTVEAGSTTTLYVGILLAPNTVYEGGELLVAANGTIACVGCDCSGAAGYAGATRVLCPEVVVSPGLINTHDHITFSQGAPKDHGTERYEHRHDWRKGKDGHTKITSPQNKSGSGVKWVELRQILSGTTSMNGSGQGDQLLRNLDKSSALLGLQQPAVDYETFPLGDNDGTKLTESCNYDFSATAQQVESMAAFTPHIAEGIDEAAHNEVICTHFEDQGGEDVTGDHTAVIHGVGLTALEIALWAESGTSLIWSPRSNVDLYGHTASVPLYARLGVNIALGTDWSYSGSMNMLRELQCADYLNTNHYDHAFSDHALWNMATGAAAAALEMDDAIGRLEVGRVADLALFDARENEGFRAVIDAQPDDVLLVARAGDPLYGDAALMAGLGRTACETIDVCGASKRLCLSDEIGQTLTQLRGVVGPDGEDTYPLFFCGTPDDEPSCVPMRPGEYTGQATDDDLDGDGVANADVSCPRVFNPAREMDGNRQADHDGDGVGDLCDVCPLDADTEQCSTPDPNDLDGDGTPNARDNCPNDANEGQADRDEDGIGDLCDPCPDTNQSGSQGGEMSIPALGDICHPAHPQQGATVEVIGRVTALGTKGFWMQDPDADAFAGVYVFLNAAPTGGVALGVEARVSGEYSVYYDLTEIKNATVTVTNATPAPVAPLVLPASALNTTAADAERYENMLVRVEGTVTVTSANPDGPADDFKEMEVTDAAGSALRIDDFIWNGYVATRTVGTTYRTLIGISTFSFSNRKVLPRGAEDLME